MSTTRMTHLGILLITLSLLGVACADLNTSEVQDNTAEKFGQAARVGYSCEVATIDSNGSQWLYQTKEIMNLMSAIQLSVYQDDTLYGPVSIPKVSTDTFSDGNLTVKLVQNGIGKSIEVNHKNMSLFARAENGWCSSFETDRYADNYGGSTSSWGQDADNGRGSNTPESQPEFGAYDQFQIKMSAECGNPCAFFVETNMQVKTVVYEADGWIIAEQTNPSDNFGGLYTFSQTGLRNLTATGYDQYGNFVANDTKSFTVLGSQTQDNQPSNPSTQGYGEPLNVPYYYQYNNSLHPSRSCQNTSAAMVLSYLGVNIRPDEITQEFGKDRAQSLDGMNYVFNLLASRYGVKGINSLPAGTIADLKGALDQGNPVIAHGFFTGGGHLVVVVGYDDNGYYVNDPAGTWSGSFGGGYPRAYQETTQGKAIYYPKRAFELAIMTWDGATIDSAYLHILR